MTDLGTDIQSMIVDKKIDYKWGKPAENAKAADDSTSSTCVTIQQLKSKVYMAEQTGMTVGTFCTETADDSVYKIVKMSEEEVTLQKVLYGESAGETTTIKMDKFLTLCKPFKGKVQQIVEVSDADTPLNNKASLEESVKDAARLAIRLKTAKATTKGLFQKIKVLKEPLAVRVTAPFEPGQLVIQRCLRNLAEQPMHASLHTCSQVVASRARCMEKRASAFECSRELCNVCACVCLHCV